MYKYIIIIYDLRWFSSGRSTTGEEEEEPFIHKRRPMEMDVILVWLMLEELKTEVWLELIQWSGLIEYKQYRRESSGYGIKVARFLYRLSWKRMQSKLVERWNAFKRTRERLKSSASRSSSANGSNSKIAATQASRIPSNYNKNIPASPSSSTFSSSKYLAPLRSTGNVIVHASNETNHNNNSTLKKLAETPGIYIYIYTCIK